VTDTRTDVLRGSATVEELRKLSPRIRRTIGVSETMLLLLDAAVSMVRVMMDSSDNRPAMERFSEVAERIKIPEVNEAQLEIFKRKIEEPGYVDHTIRKWTLLTSGTRKFLVRSTGAATSHRLNNAINKDSELLFAGLAHGVKTLLPIAQAIDSCGQFSSKTSTDKLFGGKESIDPEAGAFVALGVRFSEILEMLGELRVEDLITGNFDQFKDIIKRKEGEAVDLSATVERLAAVVTSDARQRILSLSERLGRKIQGARDVLDTSADGASQAANSLVEFVDRLLRSAAPTEEILTWLEGGSFAAATHIKEGSSKLQPTKRGQALFFISAGGDAERFATDTVANYMVDGLIGARTRLQQIKHADVGDEAEKNTIRRAANAIEGFVTYSLKLGWMARPDADIESLRLRLAQ
jgi:hypothetical protein